MTTIDDYIDQLLADMQAPEALQNVVQNILDDPIPEEVKKRLLKPLLPGKYRPLPERRGQKRKAIVGEFDPTPPPLKHSERPKTTRGRF